MALEGWSVQQIDNATAQQVVIERHYLHRKAPCSKAFGLFNPQMQLYGVIIYGTPSSAPLRGGIAGPEESLNVVELTRLWVDDDAPKNGESFLIGRSVRKAGKEIVVSFADTAENHAGVVYQATNWLYTGLSAKRTSWSIKGESKHGQSWADKFSAKEIREIYGDRFELVQRSRKHRYIFINAKGKRKQELLSKLRYPILEYPKTAKIEASQGRVTPDPQNR